jgi:hypothetical protein
LSNAYRALANTLRATLAPLSSRRSSIGQEADSAFGTGDPAGTELTATLPVMVIGHSTLGSFPADDSAVWQLG